MTILETILDTLTSMTVEGATGLELEAQAANLMSVFNVEPAFLGYVSKNFDKPYPNVMCVSLNGEVIHGIPDARTFQDGDVIKLDIGIKDKDGQFDDGATTVVIGRGSAAARRLVKANQAALEAALAVAKAGSTTNDIARAVEAVAKEYEVSVIHGFGGHGIGTELHMEPFIPNEIDPNVPEVVLEKGMRIAIEPMFSTSKHGYTEVAKDGWTIKLVGGGLAAHFERTITI
jgi:methionyl aminopeptidase